MSTETSNNQENIPMDSATEMFFESLNDGVKTGESPADKPDGDGSGDDKANAQAASTNTNDSPVETPSGENTNTDNQNTNQPSFDINKYLEESSEGLFKTEEDFKSALSKIKEHDTLTQQVQVLQSEKETIFANDYIKKLNSLHKEGRSPEQIASFEKLSKLDLDKLDPKEALIQDKVLNDGVTRAIAERIVAKQYGLDKLSIDDDTLTEEEIQANKEELETAQELMRIAAKPVVENLRKELDGLTNFESPEQRALDEAARKKSYEKALEPFTQKLAESFPKEIRLEVEEGVVLTYPLPEGFADSVKQEALGFFNHPDMQVNEESVNEFVTIKKALALYSKQEEILKHSYNQGKAQGVKEKAAEFENLGGIRNPDADVHNGGQSVEDSLMAIANGKQN